MALKKLIQDTIVDNSNVIIHRFRIIGIFFIIYYDNCITDSDALIEMISSTTYIFFIIN